MEITNETINGVAFEVMTIGNHVAYSSEELNGFSTTFIGGTNKFTMINHNNGKQVEVETERDVKERASKTLLAQSKMNFCTLKGLS